MPVHFVARDLGGTEAQVDYDFAAELRERAPFDLHRGTAEAIRPLLAPRDPVQRDPVAIEAAVHATVARSVAGSQFRLILGADEQLAERLAH